MSMSTTESEATKVINGHIQFLRENWKPYPDSEVIEALKQSIYALEEIQQYKAIGTVSEFRELKEKATAKKAVLKKGVYHCPSCGMAYAVVLQGYCTFCGQHMN